MNWEIEIIKCLQQNQNVFFDFIFFIFSFFASYIGILLVFVFLYIFYKKYSYLFLFTCLFNVGFNYILKILFNRPRPYEISNEIINFTNSLGKSFPSGHMVCATTIIFFVLLISFNSKTKKKTRIAILLICVMFLIGVALSRMYFGQHYLTDIIAGILLALCLSIFFYCIYNKIYGIKHNNKFKKSSYKK